MSDPPATTEPPGAVDTAPCYCCGGTRAVPAGRWWLLPILTSHVRCLDCGRTFNGDTGQSNGPVFAVYLLCLAAGLLLGAVVYQVAPTPPG